MNIDGLEQLPIPDSVIDAKQRTELARVWLADGDQVAVISSRLWDDPGVWGLMLVDLARHVAGAYGQSGSSRDGALKKIREAMEAEWSHPT